MYNVISLKAIEEHIKSELSKFGLMLPLEEMDNITSFILFVTTVQTSAKKELKWISLIGDKVHKHEFSVCVEKDLNVCHFTLSDGKQTHKWDYTLCYSEQSAEQVDATPVNTDKVFADILHLIGDKSLYRYDIYKGDIKCISEEIHRLKDAAYSAVNFLDGVVNDCIYQESSNVEIVNAHHMVVKYPFRIGVKKGFFVFTVVKDQETAAVSYTTSYEGFECAIWDVLIVNL